MTNRRVRALVALGLACMMFVSACDSPAVNPTPITQNTSQPTSTEQPTPSPSTQEATSTPTAAPEPTATSTTSPPSATPTSAAGKEPLTLNPVVIETTDAARDGIFKQERTLNLPPGFRVKLFANGLNNVRWMGVSPEGVVYATVRDDGRVVTLPDADKDGVADEVKTFADGFEQLHGIDFKDGAVYVATEKQVIRLEDTNKDGVADQRLVMIDGFPAGGNHLTRTIVFGPDGMMYVSMGSECNACIDPDPRQAAISRYTPDWKFDKVYAKGLRNAVGFLFHPITKQMWATNNGRDMLGDDLPPETIHNVREDGDYGYPYCYGDRVPDETQEPPPGYCEQVDRPAVLMQAHSAPLGLAFYMADHFPSQFKGDMFVAFHGSWNRSQYTGYKVARIRFKDNQPDTSAGDLLVEDFATGWQQGNSAWGRPVQPIVAPDGLLLLTDDTANVIYSIYYREDAGS